MSLTACTHRLDPIYPSPLGHLMSHLASSLFTNPPPAPGSLPLSECPSLGPAPSSQLGGVELPVSHQEVPPPSGPSQGGGGAAC